ncbi:MAG: CRTAC1 family protein, partial [Planctomycetaceae bacterium]|nr:CRTAC1 family protein [Planctomycetaceae bacterium]
MPQQVAQNKIALIAILLGVFVVLGYFAYQRSAKQQIDNDDHSETNQIVLTQSDLTELLETKNLGIALLENEKLEQSIAKFKEVIQKSPTEPLGPQNLSVSLLMQLEAEATRKSKEDLNRLIEQTRQAVKQLQSIEPDSATPYLFSAKLAGIENQNDTQIAQLLEATQRDQNAPTIWYALYKSYVQSDSSENNKQAAVALLKAHHLDQKNLFLLTELLLLQSQEKDLAVKQSLTLTLNVIQPFIPSIKKMTRLDANALIEETLILINENSDAAQWKQATRNIRILVNVLKPEDLLQSDRRRISKNMLEYIKFQFSDSLTKQILEIETTQNDILAIKFTKPDPNNPFPESSSIRSFQLGDFNLDNKTEIIVLTDNQLAVWSQTGNNSQWEQITQFSFEQPAESFILVDLDGDIEQEQNTTILNKSVNPRLQTGPQYDADLDVILIGANGIRMLENIRDAKTGVRSLVLVNKSPLLKELASAKKVLPIDFDHDGDLDLCIAIQNGLTLWKQLSAFEFQQVSHESILPKQEIDVHSLIAVDWDRDVDLDIVVGTSQGQHLGLLENMKHGRFRWKEFAIDQLAEGAIADLQVLDFDANASWDLLLATQAGIQAVSTETSATGNVTLSPAKKISQIPSTGIHLSDFDNNGWLDILSQGEKTQQILLADARGTFSEQIPVSDLESIRLSRSADFDRDGDLDLCVLGSNSSQSGNNSIQILHNQGGNKNHWFEIGLRAEQIKGNQRSESGRVNHYGIGSLLELKAGRLFQPRTITSQTTHFGLGQHAQADVLRILWTNGIPINVIEPETNSRLYEKQTLKGSCPYLYAWNGQKYDFVTDLLWAAPLGLITPTGSIAPHREWEYLLITGDQLKPQAGSYNLQITEELWEAAYFDTVQLIAIDHPADVQIYSNEKVGPAHLATFGIHTVQNARQPKSIVNQHDDNLLELVSKRDDLYAKAFHTKQVQGIVE